MLRQFYYFFLAFTILSFSSLEAESAWELSKQVDGITVYVRNAPNSELKSFKGVAAIPARLTSLLAAIEDVDAFPQLFYQCKSAKSLKKVGDNEFYNYVVTGMPWPVSSRDSITHSIVSQDKKTKRVNIAINSEPNMIPQKAGIVRIQKLSGYWQLTPLKDGTVEVVYELSIAPGGKIPTWLINLLIVDTPFNTLKNLRELVKKSVYKNAKRDSIID